MNKNEADKSDKIFRTPFAFRVAIQTIENEEQSSVEEKEKRAAHSYIRLNSTPVESVLCVEQNNLVFDDPVLDGFIQICNRIIYFFSSLSEKLVR
ncbi:MAG: hypothetical protein ACLFQV_04770 [Vulcanimicrobiota bacterium]